jgi:hypothetical protein
MVHHHTAVYKILFLAFLCITVILILMGAAPIWPLPSRVAIFIISLFFLLLALVYLTVSNQESRGY